MSEHFAVGPYVLGLDIGVASVGWAVVACKEDGTPHDLTAAGSHLFEPGTEGSESDRKRGRDVARNQQRRTARLMRRQTWRRARRKRLLLRTLIDRGLLPPAPTALRRPLDIDAYLKALDADLRAKWLKDAPHADHQRLPYLIRATAAQRRVELHELGRAFYHMAQRRGFLSNRRAEAGKQGEDSSVVRSAIGELQTKMEAHDPPTLGAYLASLDPDEQRLRDRWTGRTMYLSEFEAIWSQQQGHHDLPEETREDIHRAIFHQRPLKDQRNLIGRCSLIPGERRAPISHRLYQRFRVLQTVNNALVGLPDQSPRPLQDAEREALLTVLLRDGDMTFAKVRKLLGFPRSTVFNLEEGDKKSIIGHRTDAKLRKVFGDRYDALSEEERGRLVEDLRSFRLPEALIRCGAKRWGLAPEAAQSLAAVDLEEGYGSVSLAAIDRLMPLLEQGAPFAHARRQLFPETFRADTPADDLPPALNAIEDLRNPAVSRALTEVRRLVNAVVRRYGKPLTIRVELARELKNPRSVREKITRRINEQTKSREQVRERILKEAGIVRISREDIDKVLLADECGWHCPYTGRSFGMAELVGPNPQFDVEHIWPRSRSLDDSFLNKTICYHEENRSRKRGRTPCEAYSAEQLAAVAERVSRFKGDPFTRREKLRRFTAETIDTEFANRHLSDTRFIARAAADYLGLLYGGRADGSGTQRVQVCTGGLTAWLRSGWGISGLLGDSVEKNRADHRHHAVDAVIVALSEPRAVQALARAASDAEQRGARRAFERVEAPWAGFRERVAAVVEGILVSHRQSRKVAGPLHDQTIYSRSIRANGHQEHRVRKELFKLTPSEIRDGKIVDARALAAIRAKLAELGKPTPTPQEIGKIFGDPANAPLVPGHGGGMVRLRKVRVRSDVKPRTLGGAAGARFVSTASNHHTVIYTELDADGREKRWADEPTPLLDAYARQAASPPLPIVRRELGTLNRFLFSLSPGEYVEIDAPSSSTDPGGRARAVYRVCSVSQGDMELRLHSDGRTADEIKKAKARVRASAERLRKLNARKILVTYLGEVRRAGG